MKNLLSVLLFLSFQVLAQNEPITKYSETITQKDLLEHLSILASDALGGRETGKAGQKMAAAYIAEQFKNLGLVGPVKNGGNSGFYQPINLYTSSPGDIYIEVGKKRIVNDYHNMVYYGNSPTSGVLTNSIVFVGGGTEEDFEGKDVKGKIVLTVSSSNRSWRDVAEVAEELGAVQLFVVNYDTDEGFAGYASQMEHYLTNGRLSIDKPKEGKSGVFFLKPSTAAELLGVKSADLTSGKKISSVEVTYSVSINTKVLETENVLGYLEGTDLKEELVVLTAHYDHVGMDDGKIYNGADDDGSGTVAVLELAEAFVKAKKEGKGPRRSILFMTVTGEEKGLLGSEYYTKNPVFELKKTVVNLNIDMIGRVDPEHTDSQNYVYLVGSDRLSSELHELSEKANSTYTKFNLDYTYNDEGHPDRIYYRSDHWNFAKNNIPIIFYFNGVHEDYHKPTDTVDKINFELLQRRTQLVYYTAWIVANRDDRLVVDKLQSQQVDSK